MGLNSFAEWKNFHGFLLTADFFSKPTFSKIVSGIPPECQTDWIRIRPDILSGLIWVQFAKVTYGQTTLVGNGLNINIQRSLCLYNSNDIARKLKKLHTSKGDYWIKQ